MLGPVPLVRWLIGAALLSLVGTAVSFGMEPDLVTGELTDAGVSAPLGVFFVISAAGLGASFYALFTAFYYINNRSYDSVRNSTYFARWVLGLVAGLILAMVLIGSGIDAGIGTVGLAIVGGFSSDIVFRILKRLAETVEFMILGKRDDGGSTGT